jgi:DNA-binding NtrC family response regulator
LRERPDDVSLLLQHFLQKFSSAQGTSKELTLDADRALQMYQWPGNVRELENVVERAILLAGNSLIGIHHLPEEIRNAHGSQVLSLEEVERTHIKSVLQIAQDYDEAARILGIDRKTLLNKRKKYNL